jgi:predicted acylesterase/phospholipase RssA
MAVPPIAPAENDDGPKRSLVLAGGGMRVAYQAGVLLALDQAGLRFGHVDGTSGGTINLAMALSGHNPAEMCERWRTLNPHDFVSMLPLKDYTRTVKWPALGGSAGVVNKVFPHLGIDPATIRDATGVTGTFNVCNFSRKVSEVIEHTDIDLDLLVAGISLPLLMPAVRRNGQDFTDAVWIRDANVLEAVRRGSDEIWLVWCIGNTDRYMNGLFRQYVHMIEISANGSLFEDFERVRAINSERPTPVRLHVIKPTYPIPLDPDYYLGRIDAATLIALGYSDACKYLEHKTDGGQGWTIDATKMLEPIPGASFRLTLSGPFVSGSPSPGASDQPSGQIALHFTAATRQVDSSATPLRLTVDGNITITGLCDHLPYRNGFLQFERRSFPYIELEFASGGHAYQLTGILRRRNGAGVYLLVTVHQVDGDASEPIGSGQLAFGFDQVFEIPRTLHATDSRSLLRGLYATVVLAAQLTRALFAAGRAHE